MVPGIKDGRAFDIYINNVKTKNSDKVKLLEIKVNKKLGFRSQISEICRRESYKLHGFQRIRKFLTLEKAKLLTSAFINSQCNFAPLIWMFTNKYSMDKILKIHYRTLYIVYGVYNELSENPLNRSGDISIHQKHL